jgi:hypothetical protein
MQDASYHLAVFGTPPDGFIDAFKEELTAQLSVVSLTLGAEVSWYEGLPEHYDNPAHTCTAALCFPLPAGQDIYVVRMMKDGIPVIPVASKLDLLSQEFSERLSILNGLGLDKAEIPSIAICLLECASLLPRQRRVFLSYRRSESTPVALQLYAALSERLFDVFLDTHDILPGEHFQEVLWQKMCDSDVMVYLDTQSYFKSRWTTAEFGRASYKGIPIQRVGWPGIEVDDRSYLSADINLTDDDLSADKSSLTEERLAEICRSVESLRAEGVATRYRLLMDLFELSIKRSRATIEGYSLRRSLTVTNKKGEKIYVYPALGVPTTYTLHDATLERHDPPVAVVYDDAGIEEKRWVAHMEWIGKRVLDEVRLISSHKPGWDFGDWRK